MKLSTIATVTFILTTGFLAGCQSPAKWRYPHTPQDAVIDNYYGIQVPDPYRWLEDADSGETLRWVEEQNRLTERFLAAAPPRQRIRERLTELWNYPRYSAPGRTDTRYFFRKNDGLQNQSVLYMQTTLDAEPQVAINPNLLSEDGTVALTTSTASKDGTLLAYGLSYHGSDWQKIGIRNLDARRDFPETLQYCRYASIAWLHDNSGFYYNRLPDPNTVSPEDRYNYSSVWFHRLDTPQSDDTLTYHDPNNKELGFSPLLTEDGKYLLLYVYHGTDPKNRIYYRPVDSSAPFIKLLDKGDARYDPIGNLGPAFYFLTDLDAPRARIIVIDTTDPAPEKWQTVIPESDGVIDNAGIISSKLVVSKMHDVHHQLTIHEPDGTLVRQIPLPTLGTVDSISGRQQDSEMFFVFTSYLFPTTIYRYDFATGAASVFRKPEINFDPSPYETRQLFATSKDGTRIPVLVTAKKGLPLDGSNPTILYGYGGFGVNINPFFSVAVVKWLEMGGIFAVANIRGGGEYGEAWHQAGMRENKQNVFDDFTAAAEHLIAQRYTSPAKLAINGGSNGGLLTAACMLQRPDLFGAVVSAVPVTDMLRYPRFAIGRYWIPEYGDAQNSPEEFRWLYRYSPLHNIKQGATYPPIFVTTADTDDRVAPLHAKKFVAALQRKAPSKNPILLRVETKAGHGVGKPTAKIIEELADSYTFLYITLNMARQAP